MSFFKKLKEEKKYTYTVVRGWVKEDNEFHIDNAINSRRFSIFSIFKSRVFNRNMVDGLCYGKFYGIDKIRFSRKDYKRKKKSIFRKIIKKNIK
jgi:hypothetical protein